MTIKKILSAASAAEGRNELSPDTSLLTNYQMTVRRTIMSLQSAVVSATFPDYFSPATIEMAMQDLARSREHALNWKTLRYANDSDAVFECGPVSAAEELLTEVDAPIAPTPVRNPNWR